MNEIQKPHKTDSLVARSMKQLLLHIAVLFLEKDIKLNS